MKLFITGTFRAGTTLISLALNEHSRLTVTYDSVHFMRFAYLKYGKNRILQADALRLGEDINQRLETRFGKGFDVAIYRQRVEALETITYSQLYHIVMTLYVGSENWGEKTVLEWRKGGDILEMFDDIVIIHCIRDPRDILSSWKKETVAPGVDYLDAVANCYDSMKYALLNGRKFGKRYVLFKFEEFLEYPEKTMRKICKQLGISYESGLLDTSQFKNKTTRKAWMPNTAFFDKFEGISQAPIGRWHKYLAEEDLLLCEWVNGELMEKFGYRLSGTSVDINKVHKVMTKLNQSSLAQGGILDIIHRGEGVQRYPLDPFDSSTWEKDKERL